MARESDVVVRARVDSQQVVWDERQVRVLTLTSIDVIDGIKGCSKGERLTIYQVGGTLDGVTFDVPGALRFAPGEEMVFFAKRFKGQIASYGMGLGKFRVVEQDGRRVVMPEYGDVAFAKGATDRRTVTEMPPATAEPLTQFIQRIRRAAAAGAGRRGAP
jgi:hypothetical protein